ncbi:hypothetical protein [Streptosporangium amethystogenes]|uniref:hypothetical protein n=1 Tax=Streptosporangium amethystogenes TaxID=2002 RepID=UPI0012FA5FDA|nr:hypothetical protein [Streptosporangium amethystogenes]
MSYEMFKDAGHQVIVATPCEVVSPIATDGLASQTSGGAEQAARLKQVVEIAAGVTNPVAPAGVWVGGLQRGLRTGRARPAKGSGGQHRLRRAPHPLH